MFQNACALVLKLFPFMTIVNGTLFVGALLGVSELIASGPAMDVVNVALVAPGAPHPAINRPRQHTLTINLRHFMSSHLCAHAQGARRALPRLVLLPACFSFEACSVLNVSFTF